MILFDILNESVPPLRSPRDHYPKQELRLYDEYDNYKNAGSLTSDQAAMIVALEPFVFKEIADYKAENTAPSTKTARYLVDLLSRVQPINETFYRGTTKRNEENHKMPIRSWTPSLYTAKMFADDFGSIILETTTPSRGVKLERIYYLHWLFVGKSDGLGDAQAEWFLLDPDYKIME